MNRGRVTGRAWVVPDCPTGVPDPLGHLRAMPVRSVTYPPGGGLLAVLWPQGWVYWPNNGHCSACHTKSLSVTRRTRFAHGTRWRVVVHQWRVSMCVQSPVEAIARILASSAKKTPSHLGHSHLVLTRPKCESRTCHWSSMGCPRLSHRCPRPFGPPSCHAST